MLLLINEKDMLSTKYASIGMRLSYSCWVFWKQTKITYLISRKIKTEKIAIKKNSPI